MPFRSLRRRVQDMELGDSIHVTDYEEISVRVCACKLGRQLGRTYTIAKDLETHSFTVTRTA